MRAPRPGEIWVRVGLRMRIMSLARTTITVRYWRGPLAARRWTDPVEVDRRTFLRTAIPEPTKEVP